MLIFESHLPVSLSRLQHAKPDELAELREQGTRHLEFACSLARLQIERGGRVLFEYLLTASEPCLWKWRCDRWHALCSMRSVPVRKNFG